MSAGTYTDRYIDCDGERCGMRLFGSHLGLPDGHTVADVRRSRTTACPGRWTRPTRGSSRKPCTA